jgi:hypothetical protein
VKTLISLTACFFLVFGVGFGQSGCLQDQYGNKYHFTVDTTTGYVYGTVTNGQGCPGGDWPLIGSWGTTAAGTSLELTASNPEGSGGCSSAYMLKGVLPDFQWFYPIPGGEPQPGTWQACGTAVTDKPAGKGALK